MKEIKCLLLLMLTYSLCTATTIKGVIVGSKGEAIPYANISIENMLFGTFTNNEGEFELNVPNKYNGKNIIISSIGYMSLKVKVSDFKFGKKIITLQKKVIDLNEVLINIKATNGNKILSNALKKYKNNFPTSPFIGKAFLRHAEKNKEQYKWLVDAAIEIYDTGFDSEPKNIKLNVLQVRKSLDNRKIDTTNIFGLYLIDKKGISFKESRKRKQNLSSEDPLEIKQAIIYEDNRQSNPIALFASGLNVIRHFNQKDTIFDNKIEKKHNFKIDSVLYYNNEEIYKIKILPKSPIAKLNKKYGKYRLPTGWIYIRAKDYAIVELEYVLLHSNKGVIFEDTYGSKIASYFKVKFRELNKKIHPYYVNLSVPKVNNLFSILNVMSKKKNINLEDQYFQIQEVFFNEFITDQQVIANTDRTMWNNNLFSPRPYHKEFWDNFNSILETKEQKELREKLEAEIGKKNNN